VRTSFHCSRLPGFEPDRFSTRVETTPQIFDVLLRRLYVLIARARLRARLKVGMFSLRKPSAESIRHFLATQATLPFSYSAVGATAETTPAGYVVDRTRIRLGEGESVFQSAKTALRRWEQFRLGWVAAWPPETPIQPGEVVAVLGRAAGFWWLNSCRIVYVVDQSGPISRFGFAYGTLPGHVESGEERFLIDWDRVDNSVSYDILAFSKPNHVLTRLGYPLVRRTQKRFGRESAAAMLRAVGSDEERSPGRK
jgi:uncharacterized protein (UPF0548 family)